MLCELGNVGDQKGVLLDAEVVEQILHLSEGVLSHVGEHSALELGVVHERLVGCHVVVDLRPVEVLISEHVPDFAGVNRHSLLVGVVHRIVLVLEGVLESEVLLFTHLRQLLLHDVGAGFVNQKISSVFAVACLGAGFVLEHVNKVFALLIIKRPEYGHKLFEVLLVLFVLLVGGLGGEVEALHEGLELLRLSVEVLQELGSNELLVVEFSDLLLGVELYLIIFVIIFAVEFSENGVLSLPLLGLGQLRSLGQEEW